ncbi:phosphate ABC transporter permease PstA [bacterium]|nr:phosphate ABC transporter permease PstA [bacterium]
MKERSLFWRKFRNKTTAVLSTLSALLGLFILSWILYTVILRGVSALNWAFFTELPAPPGMSGGGLANAISGTLIITVMATIIGVPVGLLAGIYLSEFGQNSKLADVVRFFSNILMGTPSIIIGIFVYGILVVPVGHFSAYSGAAALSIMMMPVVARTTEDMMQMVPAAIRESALALGAPRWRTTLQIVFRSAKKGLITGVLLAVARVSGETAPLLFTALNSPYWPSGLGEPFANLTVTIFNYAMSPYEDWQRMAWGASLLITLGVFAVTLITRFVLADKKQTQ